MQLFYQLAADATVLIHVAFVLFVVLGQLLILLGVLRGWRWVRGFWFRVLHLLCIVVVIAESLVGITCPLTAWEQQLRSLAGQETYTGDFLARWAHDLLFFEGPPWAFTLCYSLFGLLVLATFVLAPPRVPGKLRQASGEPSL